MKCPALKPLRDEFINKFSEVSYLKFEVTIPFFHILITGGHGDHEITKLVCNFVSSCFKKRNDILVIDS